jgi:hypothetical protein
MNAMRKKDGHISKGKERRNENQPSQDGCLSIRNKVLAKRDDGLPRGEGGLSREGEGQPREDEGRPGRNGCCAGYLRRKVEQNGHRGFGGQSRKVGGRSGESGNPY